MSPPVTTVESLCDVSVSIVLFVSASSLHVLSVSFSSDSTCVYVHGRKSALRANFWCNERVRRMHRQTVKQTDRLTHTHMHSHKHTHIQHTTPPSLCHHSQSFERHSFLSFWSPHMRLASKTSFLCESDSFRSRFQVENRGQSHY